MGGGSAVRQCERRFHQGKSIHEDNSGSDVRCKKEVPGTNNVFGKYVIRKTKKGEYELLKGGESIGWFSVAVVKNDRVLFPLSQGMLLEVSEGVCREILTPEKAELCGLIASDGGMYSTKAHPHHEVHFISIDRELVDRYNELFKKIYGIEPHLHSYKKRGGSYFELRTYDRGVYFDLWDLGTKPGAFQFRVPLKHLDEEGLRRYLSGFFSGDGYITKDGKQYRIGLQSTCKDGLEELRKAFQFLRFHPHEIHFWEKEKPRWRDQYHFSIPVNEHMRFINEVSTYRPDHLKRLREIERQYKRRKNRD